MAEARTASQEWRQGWPVVVACLAGMSLLGLGFMTASTFFVPLERAFHWTRAETTSAFIVYAGASILLAPLVGLILDRWGAKRLALPGCALVGIAWALFGTLNGSLLQWIGLWLLLASASQLIMVTVWSAAIARWFATSRGLALAVAMAGNGVCQLIAPNLTNYLIKVEGWRTAFVAMGLGWGGVVTLVVLFMMRDQRTPAETEAQASAAEAVTGYTVREGVRSGSFLKILFAVLICFTVTIGLTVHLVPLLATRGLSQDQAVWVYSSLGVSGAIANVVTGYLVDRLPAKPLTAAVVALSAIACLLLLQPSQSLGQRLFATTLFGFAGGGQMPAFAYIATRYFGLRSFGTLFGFVSSAMAIPAALAPYLFGLLYDQSQSYTTMLVICIPVALVASLIVLSLGRYPQFTAEPELEKAAEPLPAG